MSPSRSHRTGPSLVITIVTQLNSKVITRRGDFAALIDGFPIARAVTYVASPDVLLDRATQVDAMVAPRPE